MLLLGVMQVSNIHDGTHSWTTSWTGTGFLALLSGLLKPACLPHLFLTLTGVLPSKLEFSCLNSLLVDYLLWLVQTNFNRIKEIRSEKR